MEYCLQSKYEDDKIIAFKDINPQAPVHILVIPKKHVESLIDIDEQDKVLMRRNIYSNK